MHSYANCNIREEYAGLLLYQFTSTNCYLALAEKYDSEIPYIYNHYIDHEQLRPNTIFGLKI